MARNEKTAGGLIRVGTIKAIVDVIDDLVASQKFGLKLKVALDALEALSNASKQNISTEISFSELYQFLSSFQEKRLVFVMKYHLPSLMS